MTKALYPYRSVTKANGQNQLVPSSPKGRLGCDSLFTSWKIVFNPPDELHSNFCDAVTLQCVLDKFYIYGHLNLGKRKEELLPPSNSRFSRTCLTVKTEFKDSEGMTHKCRALQKHSLFFRITPSLYTVAYRVASRHLSLANVPPTV